MGTSEQLYLTVCEISKAIKDRGKGKEVSFAEYIHTLAGAAAEPGDLIPEAVRLLMSVGNGLELMDTGGGDPDLETNVLSALDAAEGILIEGAVPDNLEEIISSLPVSDGEQEEDFCTAVNNIARSLVLLDPESRVSVKKTAAELKEVLRTVDFPAEVGEKLEQAYSVFSKFTRRTLTAEALEEINQAVEEAALICESLRFEEPAQPEEAEDRDGGTAEGQPSEKKEEAAASQVQDFALEIDPLLVKQFVEESSDLLEKAEMALLQLEKTPDDAECINTAFRSFHTIKGTASFLSISLITELAHTAEDILHDLRDKKRIYSKQTADLVLKSVDVVKSLLSNVQEAIPANSPVQKPAGYDDLMNRLALLQTSDGETDQPVVKKEKKNPKPLDESEPETASQTAAQAAEQLPETSEAKALPTDTSVIRKADVDSSIRIKTSRLDRLIDMVGELVIAHSMVSQDEMLSGTEHFSLLKKVTQAGKIIRELQDLSLSMRMVTLQQTFQKMSRLVRDVAYKSGKDVMLIIDGEETEIDRNMVNVLNDPLVHLLRNAVDHGIEEPKERKALGKSAIARINITASSSGGNIIVTVKDDGKGLQKDKIIKRALEQGLIPSAKGMSDPEIFNLIFAPGFSTKEEITDLSGRGVGLDVVKRNIEQLRGTVDCISEPGMGSLFRLRLPLTLAITDGMVMKVGSERYVLPTVSIKISVKPQHENLRTVAGQGEIYMFRQECIPVIRLHNLLRISDAVTDPEDGLFVIIEEAGRQFAILVDELIGQTQVVIKSLGSGMENLPGVSGGAILGDGKVGLILDARGLVDLMLRDNMRRNIKSESVKNGRNTEKK